MGRRGGGVMEEGGNVRGIVLGGEGVGEGCVKCYLIRELEWVGGMGRGMRYWVGNRGVCK